MDKLTSACIDRAANIFKLISRMSGNPLYKNEKQLELHPFVQVVLKNPRLLYETPFKKHTRLNKIDACFQLLRKYADFDTANIKTLGLNGISKYATFD